MANYDTLIDAAIAAKRDELSEPDMVDRRKEIPPTYFLREHGTLHLDFGRGTGKSSYCIRNLRFRDALIVPTASEAERLRKEHPLMQYVIPACQVGERLHSWVFDIIYVDEPSQCMRHTPPTFLPRLYEYAQANLVVMLGE